MKSTKVMLACLGLLIWGAVSAEAAILTYGASLDGPSEAPPNASPGSGIAFATIDTTLHTLTVSATWSGLIGPTTVAHIHAPTAAPFTGAVGVATFPGTFPGFPVGLTSGSYSSPAPIDLTQNASYTDAFRNNFGGGTAAGAEAALIAALNNGRAYFNIHSSSFPGGEIRGFLRPVPEPSSLVLFGAGCMGMLVHWRRRRSGAASASASSA